MGIAELLFLSLALASDAFAVSISKGLSSQAKVFKTAMACGLWFGFFQALMPFISFFFGSVISEKAGRFAPYIASLLLLILGIKTLKEASKGKDIIKIQSDSVSFRTMLALAIATSVDALAAGLTLAALHADILFSVMTVATVTFILCFIGAFLGSKLGAKHENKATIAGGIILILLAAKILIEHLTSL